MGLTPPRLPPPPHSLPCSGCELADQAAARSGGRGGGGARARAGGAHRGGHERAGQAERREAQHRHAGAALGRRWGLLPAGHAGAAPAANQPTPPCCLLPSAPALPDPPQIYDYIDRHITKLDKDCKAFDAGARWRPGAGCWAWVGVAGGQRCSAAGPCSALRRPAAAPARPAVALLPPHRPGLRPAWHAEIAKERQRLGLPPVEPTVGGGSTDTGAAKRKGRKDGGGGGGEARKLTPEEQYQVGSGARGGEGG